MQLITLSGLDGSGKTTQIKKLKDYFKSQDKNYRYFHGVEYSLANKLFSKNKKPGEKKSVTRSGKFKIFLRKIFLIIDIIRFRSLYLTKNLNQEIDYIIFDRYFFDQIINILYLSKKNPPFKSHPWWLKTAQKYLIQPEIRIYLEISPGEIMERDRQIDQDKKYLEEKESLYNYFCERWHIDQVDASQGKEEVFEEIKNIIES